MKASVVCECPGLCANMAQIRQARPGSGLSLSFLRQRSWKPFELLPFRSEANPEEAHESVGGVEVFGGLEVIDQLLGTNTPVTARFWP